ncbi:PREDICTED: pulmonary surfactant-associated protein A-like [Nipponia nippon]|uniref:pulmonary surfactant-associated protein A-like n=1 Tax=Nipponia nippon TaxID=128390 RepID=UPI000511B791|nr:PREDICTED: pulmonary surfactant-associated protein A-like [Nipponia nippon]
MLSYLSYMLTAVAALLVTCHALCKCPGIPGLPGIPGSLKGQPRVPGLLGPSGSLMGLPGRYRLPWLEGLPDSLDTELRNVLVNLKHRLSRLEGVLALNGKIREVGEKIFASNGKEVDFASALESCEEAGGTLAAPMNEEENKAILDIVKQYNRYAYLGIKEGEISGQFKYINGMPLNYTKWHQYEPNGKGTENCVEMYTDGSWNDKKCNLYRLTICEF